MWLNGRFVKFVLGSALGLALSFSAMAQTTNDASVVTNKTMPPNLTMNLVLNSANVDEQNEHYAAFVESLIRQFPRDIEIDKETAKKLKTLDPAFDYMNVVAYLPRFGKEPVADNEFLMPDKRIHLLKVAIKSGQENGKDVSALEEVLLQEQQLGVASEIKEPQIKMASAVDEKAEVFVTTENAQGTIRLFDTKEAREYLMSLRKGTAPQYILDIVDGEKSDKKKIVRKLKNKQRIAVAQASTAKKASASVKIDPRALQKIYFEADAVELSVKQRQQLIKLSERLTKSGIRDNFAILVSTYQNPFVGDLGAQRLRAVRGFLRQLDINIDAGYQAVAYVNAINLDQQFVDIGNLE